MERQRANVPNNDEPARVTVRGGVLMIVPTGPSMTGIEATRIQAAISPRLEEAGGGLRALVLDLSSVSYMNSMGLGICIELRNRALRRNVRCILTGMQKPIADLFELMKVNRLFEVAEDSESLARLLR